MWSHLLVLGSHRVQLAGACRPPFLPQSACRPHFCTSLPSQGRAWARARGSRRVGISGNAKFLVTPGPELPRPHPCRFHMYLKICWQVVTLTGSWRKWSSSQEVNRPPSHLLG